MHRPLTSALLRVLHCVLFLACACGAATAFAAADTEEKAQTVVHMLDYVGVDYGGSVKDGQAVDAGEYQEQREFASQVQVILQQLPAVAGKDALLAKSRTLLARIDAKADGAEVATLSRTLAADVIRAWNVTVAPKQAPDLQKAATLFQQQCVACHGAQGRGDGPAAKGMDPAPSNFHDAARMDQRSIYGLYNTITLGVGGTPMRAFTELADADRWALAFLVSGLRVPPQRVAEGQALWDKGVGKQELGSYKALVTQSPADVAAKGAPLDAVRTYLAANPQAIQATGPGPLAITRSKLDEALAAYRAGDARSARALAVSSYLEGFELVENQLDNVDTDLRHEAERAMMALRSDIDAGVPVSALEEQVRVVDGLLDRIEQKLGEGEMSPAAAFTSALLILLREGLEAILVLAAIVAFVKKTGRRDALPYIHFGWIGALALGVLTWVAANRLLTISGANREVTEGVSALFAAAMLLYVGLWLHKRSSAQAWQTFIRDQVNSALGKRTLWAMAGISFLAVYRELFEVILFYETLWAQAGVERQGAVLAGIGVAALVLALVGWAILKYSVRLPLALFFGITSWLLVIMAVVFVGQGVAALQEAGLLASTPVHFVTMPMLGVHPSMQGLLAQGVMLAGLVGALLAGRMSARAARGARGPAA